MKKIFYSLMALMGLMLATACSDSDVTENITPENPQGTPQEIYLTANLSDVKTRVAYTEDGTGMKVQWNENDFLMVFVNREGKTYSQRSDIKLSTHDLTDADKSGAYASLYDYDSENNTYTLTSNYKFTSDKAYEFAIVEGEGGAAAKFQYTGNVIWYEESEEEKDYLVSSASNDDKTYKKIKVKNHVIHRATPKSQNMAELNVSSIAGLAMWEHPDNESGDCQIANNSTAHLKYQEVLTAEISSSNFTGNTASITLTHPKTVIFKIIMNQFLYSIHRGAHVAIRALKESTEIPGTYEDDGLIDGVYHQAREEFFAYNQTVEPAKIMTIPSVGDLGYTEQTVNVNGVDKVFAGNLDPDKTLTTYIMVDASKLNRKRYFQFSLTDNWSHDLYVWRLDLGSALGTAEAGKFFTVDLTNRVCNQFVWLGNNDYVWAIRNHQAKNIKDEGQYYRYGEMTGQPSSKSNDDYTPENYTTNVQSTWLSTLRGITADDVVNIATTGEYWKLREDFTLPGFLIDLDITYDLNHLKYQEYRIDYQYDAIYKDTKGLARMPSATYVARIYDDCDITLNATFDEKTGAILSQKKTGHKIFIPNTPTKRPSGWSSVTDADKIEVDDKTKQVRIITSTYPMNVVRKGGSSESWGSYVYYPKFRNTLI